MSVCLVRVAVGSKIVSVSNLENFLDNFMVDGLARAREKPCYRLQFQVGQRPVQYIDLYGNIVQPMNTFDCRELSCLSCRNFLRD